MTTSNAVAPVANQEKEDLIKKLESLSQQEQTLLDFLKKWKKQEKLLEERLEALKKIVQKKIDENKKKTQKEVKETLENQIPVMNEKERKRISQKKAEVEETVKTTKKIMHTASLDTEVDPQDLFPLTQAVEETMMALQQEEMTEKQINEVANELNKGINAFTKKYPQFLPIVEPKKKKKWFFESRKEIRELKAKRKDLEKELKRINGIISNNLGILPVEQSSHFVEIMNQAKDLLKKTWTTGEEIDKRSETLKIAFEQLKSIYPLQEKTEEPKKTAWRIEEQKALESKKGKLRNLIGSANIVIQKEVSSSNLTPWWKLIDLAYEAENLLKNSDSPLEDITEINQKLENEIRKALTALDIWTLLETGKVLQKPKVVEPKIEKTAENKKLTTISDDELKKMAAEIQELTTMLNTIKEENKNVEEDRIKAKNQKENLEKNMI